MLRTALFGIAWLACALPAHAAGIAANCPSLPGPHQDWLVQEHRVWQDVCQGRKAALQPPSAELTAHFLATILLEPRFRARIREAGVNITGAHFQDELNLANAKFDFDVTLDNSRFDRRLNLRTVETSRSLSLAGSSFAGSQPGDALDLAGAKIGGSLHIDRVMAHGHFNLDSLQLGGDLSGQMGKFKSIWLANAKISGAMDISDSRVEGDLQLRSLSVDKSLWMRNGVFTRVWLTSAVVGGDLALEGPNNVGFKDCPNQKRRTPRPAMDAQRVDLSAATVKGRLIFGSDCYGRFDAETNWGHGATLDLRNTSVHVLEDGISCPATEPECQNTWPAVLMLDGFTYDKFGSKSSDADAAMASRPVSWWLAWLKSQEGPSYHSQPYQHLAEIFTQNGNRPYAVEILMAAKKRELLANHYPALLVWLYWALSGFGYKLHFVLIWVIAFVFTGAAMLRMSGQGPSNRMPYGLAYSFDLLLPIVKLREWHYGIDLKGWVRYYFYVHKLMGWVLGLVLAAGVTALNK